jgi:hypothetical protein
MRMLYQKIGFIPTKVYVDANIRVPLKMIMAGYDGNGQEYYNSRM